MNLLAYVALVGLEITNARICHLYSCVLSGCPILEEYYPYYGRKRFLTWLSSAHVKYWTRMAEDFCSKGEQLTQSTCLLPYPGSAWNATSIAVFLANQDGLMTFSLVPSSNIAVTFHTVTPWQERCACVQESRGLIKYKQRVCDLATPCWINSCMLPHYLKLFPIIYWEIFWN